MINNNKDYDDESVIIYRWQVKEIKNFKIPYSHKEVLFSDFYDIDYRAEVLKDFGDNLEVLIIKPKSLNISGYY